jgi:hypothetical protein
LKYPPDELHTFEDPPDLRFCFSFTTARKEKEQKKPEEYPADISKQFHLREIAIAGYR